MMLFALINILAVKSPTSERKLYLNSLLNKDRKNHFPFYVIIVLSRKDDKMEIRNANMNDLNVILQYDHHITENELSTLITLKRVLIVAENHQFVGWLRYNLFWDNIPFLNMLYILEPFQNKGYGKALIEHFEKKVKEKGYEFVMTSTVSNEKAQHFYYHLHYQPIGGFSLNDEPFEIILSKKL